MIIGVFDSGVGGTTVLAEIKKLLPEEEYVYFADSEHCPYGEKSPAELKEIVSGATEYLLARGAKVIVVACNTATTQTIGYLREKYPFCPFVGTEPAVKKACDEAPAGADGRCRLVLLATEGTANSERTHRLIAENLREGQELTVVPCPGLAKAIEKQAEGEVEKILAQVKQVVEQRWKCEEVNGVVLGCTHYPLIRDKIQALFPQARLFDGGEGVAREVRRVVRRLEAEAKP